MIGTDGDLHHALQVVASVRYLWVSLIIGCALPSWMYFESGLHGRWLVVVGMPLCAICGAVLKKHHVSERFSTMQLFQEPLLQENGTDTADCAAEQAGLAGL